MHADIIVIGAGAAGLMAATIAAESGRHVVLLEKNRKPGAKILMSGGTRCNITQATDGRGIVEAFGLSGKFLHSALAALSPADLVAFFEDEGVKTKVESTGKVFPVSNKALHVQQALLAKLERSGAELMTEAGVVDVRSADDADAPAARLVVQTESRTLTAHSVILTTGGQSYPGSGTTGDGYAWAKRLGHRIAPPRPALVPLTTSAGWIPPLQGVTLPDVAVSLHKLSRSKNGDRSQNADKLSKPIDRRRDSFLFTHFGLSGPAVLDISSQYTRGLQEAERKGQHAFVLGLDFLPDQSEQQLSGTLKCLARTAGNQPVSASLPEELPRRLLEALFRLAKVPLDRRAAELKSSERAALTQALKKTIVPIAGTLGFKKAEVTAGGVDLKEVDSKTMQSKFCPGLYLAGEILDLDGPIGGYNFQAAFSTGFLAGRSA